MTSFPVRLGRPFSFRGLGSGLSSPPAGEEQEKKPNPFASLGHVVMPEPVLHFRKNSCIRKCNQMERAGGLPRGFQACREEKYLRDAKA